MVQETPEGVAHPEFQDPEAAAWGDQDPASGPGGEEGNGEESGSDIPGRSELEELAVEAERLVRDGIEQTERRIRRHPLASVGIAAGVGLLLGLMCGRGRGR